jgi:hypothetical protein
MGAPSVPLACVGGSMRRPDPEAEYGVGRSTKPSDWG